MLSVSCGRIESKSYSEKMKFPKLSMPTVTWKMVLFVAMLFDGYPNYFFKKYRWLFKWFLLKTELFSSPSKILKKKKSQKNVYVLRFEGNSSPVGFYSLALRAGMEAPLWDWDSLVHSLEITAHITSAGSFILEFSWQENHLPTRDMWMIYLKKLLSIVILCYPQKNLIRPGRSGREVTMPQNIQI